MGESNAPEGSELVLVCVFKADGTSVIALPASEDVSGLLAYYEGSYAEEFVSSARLDRVVAERDEARAAGRSCADELLTALEDAAKVSSDRDQAQRARDQIRGMLGDRQRELDKALARANRYREALEREMTHGGIYDLMAQIATTVGAIARAERDPQLADVGSRLDREREHFRARVEAATALAEGEQPAGEMAPLDERARKAAERVYSRFGHLLPSGPSADLSPFVYDEFRAAAGEQSTTEPDDDSVGAELSRMESDLLDIRDALAVGDDDDLPINAESIIERIGELRARSSAPSTTETATGHDYSLLDAVLPAEGERRAAIEAAADGAMVKTPGAPSYAYPLHLLRSEISAIYDAFREAAAPATPEGPDA